MSASDTQNTKLYWTLPYNCLSTYLKVYHVLVVLSTLYQEQMLTVQDVEELKQAEVPWERLVRVQCTKPPDVVKKTSELLAEMGLDGEGWQLKGQ